MFPDDDSFQTDRRAKWTTKLIIYDYWCMTMAVYSLTCSNDLSQDA
jgi:hypothetical protein